MKKTILVDSDAFFALNNSNDANFKKAVRISRKLFKAGFEFACSNFVLAEVTTLLNYRINHQKAISFLEQLKKDKFPIIRVDEEVESFAYGMFRQQTTKKVSVVDCLNMAVLKRYHWQTIFSFDKIYEKNGFKLA